MKTKTVELYIDLWPNWHERPSSECYMSAATKLDHPKQEGCLRVRIVVDLPENSPVIAVDETIKGDASVVA